MNYISSKFLEKSLEPCVNACGRLLHPESAKIFGSIVATTMALDYIHNLIYAQHNPEDFDSDEHDTFIEKFSKPLKETITIGIRPSVCLGLSALLFGRIFISHPLVFTNLIKPGFTFLSFLGFSSLGSSWTCLKQQQESMLQSDDSEAPKFARTSYRFALYSAAGMFPFVLRYLK